MQTRWPRRQLSAEPPLNVSGPPIIDTHDGAADPDAAERAAEWRAMLRSAWGDLARTEARAEDLRRQRDAAHADAERWRLRYLEARRSRDLIAARRDALVAALPGALSAMLTNGCATAWEQGRRAGLHQGVSETQNPYRADPEPPGSPAAARSRCRAYLGYVAERRSRKA